MNEICTRIDYITLVVYYSFGSYHGPSVGPGIERAHCIPGMSYEATKGFPIFQACHTRQHNGFLFSVSFPFFYPASSPQHWLGVKGVGHYVPASAGLS